MRKSMKKNFARKVKRIKSRKRNREIRASYWGWCKWGDCKNLYCVLFEQNGQRSKFITNCYNLKDVLDQAREAENNGQKIFPVENVIVKRRSLGDGKSAYYFEE